MAKNEGETFKGDLQLSVGRIQKLRLGGIIIPFIIEFEVFVFLSLRGFLYFITQLLTWQR